MIEMPQAFADAVCNQRCRLLRYSGDPRVVELGEEHAEHRYRGFEGKNGVACNVCKDTAKDLWSEYQRILGTIAPQTPTDDAKSEAPASLSQAS